MSAAVDNSAGSALRFGSAYLEHLSLLDAEAQQRTAGIPSFGVMVSLALFVHLALFVPIYLFKPELIPSPTSQVRLAFGVNDVQDIADDVTTDDASASSDVVSSMDSMFSGGDVRPTRRATPKASRRSAAPVYRPATAPSPVTQPSNARSRQVMQRPDAGRAGNNGSSQAQMREIISKYERLLSGWIEKHKTYPQAALSKGLKGRAILRLRINRRGQVLYKAIDRSSGYDTLDQAVLQAVDRAKTMPAVPQEYPGGAKLEFLIPVNFQAR